MLRNVLYENVLTLLLVHFSRGEIRRTRRFKVLKIMWSFLPYFYLSLKLNGERIHKDVEDKWVMSYKDTWGKGEKSLGK